MKRLDWKKRVIMALTVFSMFFGAGNLIFPPYLAFESGSSFIPALLGFFITAIGFPVLGLLAVGYSSGLRELGNKVHPVFGFLFAFALYLSIGPLLAIPRTAGTSWEMVSSSFCLESPLLRVLYSIVFFSLSAFIAKEPQKFTTRLGKILCPVLLVMITLLFVGSFSIKDSGLISGSDKYSLSPFTTGMTDGYQTMDAIAAIVFGIVITINIKNLGVEDKKDILREEKYAGLLSIIPFVLIYSFLAYVGRKSAYINPGATNGAQLLSSISGRVYGKAGSILISLIFIVACFNTSTSLLSSVSEFFSSSFPRIKQSIWIVIFALSSMIFSNLGLDLILKISVPILNLLYPVTITLILLEIIPYTRNRRIFFTVSGIVSFVSSLLEMTMPETIHSILPFFPKDFLWAFITLISVIIVIFLSLYKEHKTLQIRKGRGSEE